MAAARKILLFSRAIASGALVCPSGEQITNGDFETGDLTGWASSGTVEVSTVNPHSGSYSCVIQPGSYIEQDIESLQGHAVPVICITTFVLYLYGHNCWLKADITITYTDASTTVISFDEYSPAWKEIDLVGLLEMDKSVSKIKISAPGVIEEVTADDVSLVC